LACSTWSWMYCSSHSLREIMFSWQRFWLSSAYLPHSKTGVRERETGGREREEGGQREAREG
jgi:hypothetical protein